VLASLKPRLTYANVMATIAVFVALGAGGYAAASFVGSNGVIHACVTKHGQLMLVKTGAKCHGGHAISWDQQGPRGQTGNQGANGNPGPRGPSDGYNATGGGGVGSATASVTVPAGDYIAQGGCSASQINGTKDGSAEATLTADNDSRHSDTQVATVPFDGLHVDPSSFGRTTLADHTGFHLPNGGKITESCADESGSDVTGMNYDNVEVTALRVATLHG
jgi:hypothetical protein